MRNLFRPGFLLKRRVHENKRVTSRESRVRLVTIRTRAVGFEISEVSDFRHRLLPLLDMRLETNWKLRHCRFLRGTPLHMSTRSAVMVTHSHDCADNCQFIFSGPSFSPRFILDYDSLSWVSIRINREGHLNVEL